MREFTIVFDQGLQNGLQPSKNVPHKSQWLQEALGLMPEDEVLQTIPQLPTATTVASCNWPYPQIFKLSNLILVCDERAIYTYVGGTLTLEYLCSAGGATWSVADFSDYVVLTNGVCLVTRDPQSGLFSEFLDCEIPHCLSVLNLNGQLIITGPGVQVSSGFTGE